MWKCSYFVLHAQFLDTTSNLFGVLGVADQVFKLQFKRWTVVEDLSIRWNVDLQGVLEVQELKGKSFEYEEKLYAYFSGPKLHCTWIVRYEFFISQVA